MFFVSTLVVFAQETTTGEDTTTEALEEVNLDESVTPQDLEVSEPKILPDSPFYFFKNLGRRIRKRRIELGLKGVDLAEKSGLSPGFISQIERNLVSPSVSTLKKIADVLNVPVGFFFEEANYGRERNPKNRSPVVHENQRKILSPNKGVTFYLLNPDMSGEIEFILDIFEPGATTGEELYSHPGEECGLILEGELEVQLEDKRYLLKKGDSITFKSTIPHRKTNTGKTKSVSIWANTPPWF